MINDLEFFRQRLLVLLETSGRAGLLTDYILNWMQSHGWPELDAQRLDKELDYLAENELATEVTAQYACGVKRWKLAGRGRDYLEGKGLIK